MNFRGGWGWWYFNSPRVYDERIRWSASYLPAGTYENRMRVDGLTADSRATAALLHFRVVN